MLESFIVVLGEGKRDGRLGDAKERSGWLNLCNWGNGSSVNLKVISFAAFPLSTSLPTFPRLHQISSSLHHSTSHHPFPLHSIDDNHPHLPPYYRFPALQPDSLKSSKLSSQVYHPRRSILDGVIVELTACLCGRFLGDLQTRRILLLQHQTIPRMDQSEPESTDVAIVSPNADITLVVGPNKKQIRVQSVFLTETSKPFAAMLSGTLKDPNTKVIELPDDNADAMVQICIALHRHYNELSTNPPPATVLEFAIIADKYLLLETLSCVARRYWLSAQAVGKPFHAVQRHGLIGMLQYATAAWIFDDADAFWSHTRGLIIDWEDSYIVEKGTRLDIVMDQAISGEWA